LSHARYLCKGDYDDGGQYCLGFGGASVDRRLAQELLGVISPFGVEASLRALEGLSAGDAAQRAALSSKLEQLEYEAKKAFEQYDAVDARNRLVAGELERRWNEKLEEITTVKQRLTHTLHGRFGKVLVKAVSTRLPRLPMATSGWERNSVCSVSMASEPSLGSRQRVSSSPATTF
jgi:hypothetical protein